MVVLASSTATMVSSVPKMGGNSNTLVDFQQSHKKSSLILPSTRPNSHSFSLSTFSNGCIAPNSPLRTPAVAVAADTSQPSSSSDQDQTTKKYYFVVANAKFMLDEEEHFKELMYERLRNFGERNIEQDFWLVIEPKFLDKFPNITKRLKRPAVTLVSTNGPWITFMKLRLDRVLAESYEADSLEEALASNPTTLESLRSRKSGWPHIKSMSMAGGSPSFLPHGSQKPQA